MVILRVSALAFLASACSTAFWPAAAPFRTSPLRLRTPALWPQTTTTQSLAARSATSLIRPARATRQRSVPSALTPTAHPHPSRAETRFAPTLSIRHRVGEPHRNQAPPVFPLPAPNVCPSGKRKPPAASGRVRRRAGAIRPAAAAARRGCARWRIQRTPARPQVAGVRPVQGAIAVPLERDFVCI